MPRLHEVLAAKRDQIVARWMEAVRRELLHDLVSNVELRDHIPGFLDELTTILRRQDSGGPMPPPTDSAAKHGVQRLRLGFDPFSLVKEYGILRKVIMDASRSDDVIPSFEEFDALSEFLTSGIATAVAQYAEEREAELRRHSQEHFAFIAHELRNPLLSAQLALNIMKRQGILPEVRQGEVLHKSLDRLADLIERSLNIALLGSAAGPNRNTVNVDKLIQEVLVEASLPADEKKIQISVDAASIEPLELDPRLISSALANLVRNAIKFTHPGGTIHIHAECDDESLRIEVADACGGLPPGKIDTLFTPFVQAGTDRSGFGLGLAIARGAIENHGGSLSVYDRPGHGCTFVIAIPLAFRLPGDSAP